MEVYFPVWRKLGVKGAGETVPTKTYRCFKVDFKLPYVAVKGQLQCTHRVQFQKWDLLKVSDLLDHQHTLMLTTSNNSRSRKCTLCCRHCINSSRETCLQRLDHVKAGRTVCCCVELSGPERIEIIVMLATDNYTGCSSPNIIIRLTHMVPLTANGTTFSFYH